MMKLMKYALTLGIVLLSLFLVADWLFGVTLTTCDPSCEMCEEEGCRIDTPSELWWWAHGEYPWRADSPVPPTKR